LSVKQRLRGPADDHGRAKTATKNCNQKLDPPAEHCQASGLLLFGSAARLAQWNPVTAIAAARRAAESSD
jgi:hypothetical protein